MYISIIKTRDRSLVVLNHMKNSTTRKQQLEIVLLEREVESRMVDDANFQNVRKCRPWHKRKLRKIRRS